ncbi:MAG: hypothetical protein IPG23_25250 [Burkholderiales bacterium]|nr:hypothetical protein [Burkholderiales bacterium]
MRAVTAQAWRNCRERFTTPLPGEDITQLIGALNALRDHWMELSLVLSDIVTETPSPARDAVLVDVERYLSRIKERERGPGR